MAPLGAFLIGTGHVGAGVFELFWGFLIVVVLSDGILRPKIVGRGSEMGMLPTLVGLFGGLELFGFVGLLLGPTLVGLSLAVLRLYARERAARSRQSKRHRRLLDVVPSSSEPPPRQSAPGSIGSPE